MQKNKWHIIANTAVLLGIHLRGIFKNYFSMKRLTKKRFQPKCRLVINAIMSIMINVWEKLECLTAVASVLKNEISMQRMRFSLGRNFIHV